jgi:hypothetical protein
MDAVLGHIKKPFSLFLNRLKRIRLLEKMFLICTNNFRGSKLPFLEKKLCHMNTFEAKNEQKTACLGIKFATFNGLLIIKFFISVLYTD